MNKKEEMIEKLQLIASHLINQDKDQYNAIMDILEKINNGKLDYNNVTMNAKITLEKFDGDDLTKKPVETLEYETEL